MRQHFLRKKNAVQRKLNVQTFLTRKKKITRKFPDLRYVTALVFMADVLEDPEGHFWDHLSMNRHIPMESHDPLSELHLATVSVDY